MSLETLEEYPLTSVYRKPALKPSAVPELLIFIPGNPGLVEYYITYLELIQQAHPTFEIYCISHAGYQTTGDYVKEGSKKYPVYSLDFQVKHKCKIINDILHQKGGKANLYIMAHSVGAFIVQRVLKILEANRDVLVKFVGLICPTVINIKESTSGQVLSKLSTYLPLVQLGLVFSYVLGFLFSNNAIKWMFRNFVFSSPKSATRNAAEALENSVSASVKLVTSGRIVKQTLTMAIEEMEMILEDDELNDWFFQELSAQGTKIWTYFAFTDHWVHDNTRNYILSKYHDESNPNLSFELGDVDDGITHSFCVDQSEEFAEITLKMMNQFL
ncbi:hypothetical protein PSN45_000437 [Yamadazyma tenuis]|uniref:Lipid droplet-associated hydrolase n=1 Tax=Candida tenuis (strain ATCC 10573 / BCRC 21748 / CBS 615 / JCM 9827 / NBRC 10315 / NRRL Y-1498 / VKM Y-70) TaxID=590646 RepID=G3B8J8_CANTC|nr:uncharacterized protein CANTEDRAFT_109251 [Yamadazyma tenuis ATCC 10573]EGV61750.1 hypothetical protein CANTEDRAFT_109251 [Yamadazyma tenuis ATCC 10573]WEJ92979.1 hypothetical protein PSN45_000437 [Yamadazyma tenuis]